MWRLLPRSRFSQSKSVERAQLDLVDHLYATWQTTLARAISRASGVETFPKDATTALLALDSRQYAAVDRAIRYGDWDMGLGRVARGPVALAPATGDQEAAESYLFTASCNANGFIREQALLSFVGYSGRVALAAALIRCEDWVPEVQQRAIELLQQLIAVRADRLWDLVDLLLVLKRRTRIWEQAWAGVIEPALSDPSLADARWRATNQGSMEARLLAYHLVAECEPDKLGLACLQGVRDEHAAVARWALEQAMLLASPAMATDVLELGLKHPHPFVRADALRRIAALGRPDTRTIATSLLFDPRSAPRNAARHILKTHFQVDAATHWRQAVEAGVEPRATISVVALVEHAEAKDLPIFLALLRDERAALRVAGLRGIAKVDTDALANLLPDALNDTSSKVIRQAIRIGLKHPGLLSESAIRMASAAGVQAQMVRAARTLGKWGSIKLLLDWLPSADVEATPQILFEISRWLRRQNVSFSPLKHDAKAAIEMALSVAGEKLPVTHRKSLAQILRVN